MIFVHFWIRKAKNIYNGKDVPVPCSDTDEFYVFYIVGGIKSYGPEVLFVAVVPVLAQQYLFALLLYRQHLKCSYLLL